VDRLNESGGVGYAEGIHAANVDGSQDAPIERPSLQAPHAGQIASPVPGASAQSRTDPQVLERPARRRFTTDYKRRILEEADSCSQPGQIGALLRREGLYSSILSAWRRERDQALAQALAPRRRGRKPSKDSRDERIAQLGRENRRLRQDLERARLIIEIQKKLRSSWGWN
jgi:transposase-like protein